MNVRDLQIWLNAKGANLAVDGKGGPATRAAILSVFRNTKAPAVTKGQLEVFAMRLGGTVKQIAAVAMVESAGGGFDDAGRPKVLYERHYAWRRLRVLIPLLSNPSPGGYTIDADRDGINDSWEKVADMACRNPDVAFESASWGKFQVMGAWAVKLGYPNAIEFAWSMVVSEAGHYEALVRYIERFGLIPAFRQLSANPAACTLFARGYNGPKQQGYDQRLARAMR